MPTDTKTIQAYNRYASVWAQRIRSGKMFSHSCLERPAMLAKLKNIKGKSVLCLGCGSGEECKCLKNLGAKKVVGVDICKGLINVARKSYPELEFYEEDIEKLAFLVNLLI